MVSVNECTIRITKFFRYQHGILAIKVNLTTRLSIITYLIVLSKITVILYFNEFKHLLFMLLTFNAKIQNFITTK